MRFLACLDYRPLAEVGRWSCVLGIKGYMTLTRRFSKVKKIQEHIRSVTFSPNLVSQIKGYNIEKMSGSSGIIRKTEKTVYKGYAQDLGDDD
ncbi:hypothetical protein Leryth_008038 [Lithospermum erythrorhizon]|nr:hypothetical protein Leryth_008038 [Lithospermum erythrorhizon]